MKEETGVTEKKKKRNAFQEFMDFIDDIVMNLCVIFMFLMFVLVLLQVFSRYLLPFSLSWTEELARFLMLWLIFLGASHIAKASSYIRVDFLVKKMSGGIQKALNILAKLTILIVSGYFAWLSFTVFTTTAVREVSPSMQIPMIIPRFSMVIGFALVFLQAISSGGMMLLSNEEEEDLTE